MIHRVDIQQVSYADNSTGEREPSFSTAATGVPAEVLESGSREVWYARQTNIDASVVVRMRWNSVAVSSGRLVFKRPDGDRVLDILSTSNPDGKRIELLVNCKENIPRG